MITGVKSNEPKISDKTTKEYYVIMDDGNPVGVCTKRDASICFAMYTVEKDAKWVQQLRAHFYEDSSGFHEVKLVKVPRMKMSR